MSSNQSSVQSRKMGSISRKIGWRVVSRRLSGLFWINIFIVLLIMGTWFCAREYTLSGKVDLRHHDRHLSLTDVSLEDIDSPYELFEALQGAKYTVSDSVTGKIILEEHYFGMAWTLFVCAFSVFMIEIGFTLFAYPIETARTRRILKPLNEMAVRLDEFSKMDLSEDKYHLIEEKIAQLEPDEEFSLSSGDEDLVGIERAMNNLLERIRESNKQQARFVNDASHELRTPIAVIEGYANMLSRWGKEDEKVLDESISAIQHESSNMKHLVEQLLFLARGDAGRTVVKKEKVSLNRIMQEVYEESLMIDEDHIYKLTVPESEIYITGDEGLLKQAVRILVDNSAKYTESKDEILLSVGISDINNVYMQVQDTGIGMKEADVEHMFERFYRADEARSFEGTGLGLSIAKWIVDKHGGHFKITSREELGTRIGIILPRINEEVIYEAG
ncbi:MAG: HAMP domain-containing histidine kinase [Lachnospiraceae bacterium]|nr:HAMP domain-containing histidine kinase [Lachnospiraceae bacterium]